MTKTKEERKQKAWSKYMKLRNNAMSEYYKVHGKAWNEYEKKCNQIDKEGEEE